MTIFYQAFNIISQALLYTILSLIVLGLIFYGITCLLDKVFGEKW